MSKSTFCYYYSYRNTYAIRLYFYRCFNLISEICVLPVCKQCVACASRFCRPKPKQPWTYGLPSLYFTLLSRITRSLKKRSFAMWTPKSKGRLISSLLPCKIIKIAIKTQTTKMILCSYVTQNRQRFQQICIVTWYSWYCFIDGIHGYAIWLSFYTSRCKSRK